MHSNTVYYCPGDFGRGQSHLVDVRRADGQPKGVVQEGIGLVGGRRYDGRVVLRAEGVRAGEGAPEGKRLPISFDEWNVTHRSRVSDRTPRGVPDAHALALQARSGARAAAGARQNYALADGLYAASFFNVVLRNADHVTMANQAQLVNLLGLIETSDVDAYGTPEYLAFRLYVDHSGPVALHATSEGPTFDAPAVGNMPARRGEPVLDVAATADRDRRRVWVHAVNRDPERSIAASIDLGGRNVGRVVAHALIGPHPWARNSFGDKAAVRIESGPAELAAGGGYAFPACSATALEIELTG